MMIPVQHSMMPKVMMPQGMVPVHPGSRLGLAVLPRPQSAILGRPMRGGRGQQGLAHSPYSRPQAVMQQPHLAMVAGQAMQQQNLAMQRQLQQQQAQLKQQQVQLQQQETQKAQLQHKLQLQQLAQQKAALQQAQAKQHQQQHQILQHQQQLQKAQMQAQPPLGLQSRRFPSPQIARQLTGVQGSTYATPSPTMRPRMSMSPTMRATAPRAPSPVPGRTPQMYRAPAAQVYQIQSMPRPGQQRYFL